MARVCPIEVKRRMAMECEIDRLSALPDHVLSCNIFSHLSLPDVIRTSILSSRWRFLWKEIHHLDFSYEFFRTLKLSSKCWSCNENVKYINEIIDNIFLLHSGHIESFSISPCFLEPGGFRALRVEQWVHHAALKEVKRISLKLPYVELGIPASLFACLLLKDLKLKRFWFTKIPTEFGGFRSLQSLYLSRLYGLGSDRLNQLIESCPILHKLVLARCWSLIDVKIRATNLNSLNIMDFTNMKSLTVDCPQLVELEIATCDELIEFKIYSCELFRDLHVSDAQIPKNHPMMNSLKKFSMKSCPRISDLTLLTILGCFCNLEEVHIQSSRGQIYEKDHSEQERAKGEVVADLTFPSLTKAYVYISGEIKKEEAAMLAFLLNHAPSLNTITATLLKWRSNINKVLDLQQTYEKVNIRMKFYE